MRRPNGKGADHSLPFHKSNELWNLASVLWFALIMDLPISCKIIPIKHQKKHSNTCMYVLYFMSPNIWVFPNKRCLALLNVMD